MGASRMVASWHALYIYSMISHIAWSLTMKCGLLIRLFWRKKSHDFWYLWWIEFLFSKASLPELNYHIFSPQTVSTAPELRKPVYRTVAARAIDYDHVLQLMSTVRWDIREIVSQYSDYVNVLLKEMDTFSYRLSQLSTNVPIPQPVHQVLWEHCISLANRTLVEG